MKKITKIPHYHPYIYQEHVFGLSCCAISHTRLLSHSHEALCCPKKIVIVVKK